MKVPLLDLSAQLKPLRREILEVIERVLDTQRFILGDEVAQFEKAVETYLGGGHAVACASGSDALLLALMALDLKPGEGVITTPFSFFATVSAITRLQGRPFFIDIAPATYNVNPSSLEAFLKDECVLRQGRAYHKKTRTHIHSILPVHLFGQCAPMEAIIRLAKAWNLHVIEDAAQALGAQWQDKPAGLWGHMACFSFFPSKNLGALGDGGMVVTNDAQRAERLRLLRVHGAHPKYYHKEIGINSRLDTLQAAVLLVKLKHLDAWAKGRIENARRYDEALRDLGPRLHIPSVLPDAHMVYNQYSLRVQHRDACREHLDKAGVGSEIYYPVPLHLQECFRFLGYRKGDFPEAEQAAQEALAIPIYPELPSAHQAHVIESLRAFAKASHALRCMGS